MIIKILAIGDIVGKPGRTIIEQKLKGFVQQERIDLVIGNGENVAGGNGITQKEAEQLFAAGVHVITGGDHVWGKREIIPYLDSSQRLLRPANYPEECPGRGSTIVETLNGIKVGVIHVLGRTFMNPHTSCPFKTMKRLCDEIRQTTPVIVIDMHAEVTSEKIASGWYLDGTASFIFGTHTHVQTADERILPRGTAYITDVGMTGPYESILGRKIEAVLHRFLTQMPAPFDIATDDVRLCGATAEVDSNNGRAVSIKRVCLT